MAIELTRAQRESVEYDAGDLLVKGVPGSGKSVVLLERALRFNQKAIEEGVTKKIIILTYANSLVKYTEELVDLSGLDPRMIELSTVSKLCLSLYLKMTGQRFVYLIKTADERETLVNRAIQKHLEKTNVKHRFHDIEASFWADEFLWIKQKNIATEEEYTAAERVGRGGKVRLTREDRTIAYALFQEYCALLAKEKKYDGEDIYTYLINNAEKISKSDKYDYILVDEAQDLSYAQLKVAKLLTLRTITIAADKAQKIYNTTFSWKELGIDIRGRASKALEKTFRSTKQIVQLAESLLEVNRGQQGDKNEYTDSVLPEREGTIPQVISCKTGMDERDIVINLVKRHASKDAVGILYRSKSQKRIIEGWMRAERITYEEISKNSDWSLNRPGVKISTLHSSKGLEFGTIIIPEFNEASFPPSSVVEGADPEQMEDIKMQERSLLYVGMTRAKYDLYLIFSGKPSCYLYEFEPDFYEYISNDGTPLQKPKHLFIPTVPKVQAVINDKSQDDIVEDKIRNGSVVLTHKTGEDKVRKFIIDTHKYPIQVAFLDHRSGDAVVMRGETYVIDEIR